MTDSSSNNNNINNGDVEEERIIKVIPENISIEDLKKRIIVNLANEEIWNKFKGSQLEMVCNKSGRSIYPKLSFDVKGLEQDNCYLFSLAFPFADNNPNVQYKYVKGDWVAFPCVEETSAVIEFPHFDNIKFPNGYEWMYHHVGFEKIKITNSADTANNNIVCFFERRKIGGKPVKLAKVAAVIEFVDATHVFVKTFRKYRPRLYIYRFDPDTVKFNRFYEKDFPVADFIAVTAYRNSKVTDIKIQHNNYASGFRIENISLADIVAKGVPSTAASTSQSPFTFSLPSSSSNQYVFRQPIPLWYPHHLQYHQHYYQPYFVRQIFQQRPPPPPPQLIIIDDDN